MAGKRLQSNKIDTKQFQTVTSNGTKLFGRVESDITVERNGASLTPVPNSTVQRYYYTTGGGSLGETLAATRTGNEKWTFVKDVNGNFILGEDARNSLNGNTVAAKTINAAAEDAITKRTISDGTTDFRLTQTQAKVGLGKVNPATGLPAASPTNPNAPAGTATNGGGADATDPEFKQAADLTEEQKAQFTNLGQRETQDYGSLAYPLNAFSGNRKGDYLQIQLLEYKKSGLNAAEAKEGTFGITRMDDRETNIKGTIFLPIQNGITDSVSVDWGTGEINPITAKFANVALGTMVITGEQGPSAGMKKFGSATMEAIGDLANKNAAPEMRALITNYFTQQAVGGNVQNLLARTAGAAVNNNLELLFSGPQLRSFTFNYKLTPREPAEAAIIKKIIRLFKREMAPALSPSKLFLLSPNVWKLKYIWTGPKGTGAEDHPYLNHIKRCALKDFSVNYTPDGSYMTYANGGSMTSYELSLTFAEIDPVYAGDYDTGEGVEAKGMGW